MTKVEIKCVKCGWKTNWNSPWREVMDWKISDSEYLCSDCADEIKQKALHIWTKNYLLK